MSINKKNTWNGTCKFKRRKNLECAKKETDVFGCARYERRNHVLFSFYFLFFLSPLVSERTHTYGFSAEQNARHQFTSRCRLISMLRYLTHRIDVNLVLKFYRRNAVQNNIILYACTIQNDGQHTHSPRICLVQRSRGWTQCHMLSHRTVSSTAPRREVLRGPGQFFSWDLIILFGEAKNIVYERPSNSVTLVRHSFLIYVTYVKNIFLWYEYYILSSKR